MAPPPLDEDYLQRFSEAVVQEIWNEMGRQRIRSLRELARRAGMTHTSLNARMGIDSRTGKPVVLNVRDLAAIGDALGVEPGTLVQRAFEAADTSAPQLDIDWGTHVERDDDSADELATPKAARPGLRKPSLAEDDDA